MSRTSTPVPMRTVSEPFIVVGIDPGFDRLGVAFMSRQGGVEQLLYSTCLSSDRTATLPDRLLFLGNELSQLMETYRPTGLAIETLFFNKNVKTALAVAEVRGLILYLGRRHHCTIHEYSPQAIKLAVTGYGNSDKTAVFSMLKRLVSNVPDGALDDEYDAIAVGVTCLAHCREGR